MDYSKKFDIIQNSLNLNQKDFAEKIGVSQNAISHYKLGKRKPDAATIQKLIDIGVSPLFLFSDFEEPFDEDFNTYVRERRNKILEEKIAAKEKELEKLKNKLS